MAFNDFVNNNSLWDTGGYIQSTQNGCIGNHKDLRFIMQTLHADSSLLVGGTDTILRSSWGYQGSGVAADDYCNFLHSSATDNLGAAIYWQGTRQHLIIVVYSDDNRYDTTGGVGTYISDINTRFKFWLQGISKFPLFDTELGAENWIREVGSSSIAPAFPTVGWYSQGISSGTGGTDPYDNIQGLLDFYVEFVPLYDPSNLSLLNSDLDNYEIENTWTGAVIKTFSLADRFNVAGADTITEKLWGNIAATDVRFNNINQDERKRRIFISKDPIRMGEYMVENKMVRPHVNGEANEGAVDYGFNSSYSDLKAAVLASIANPVNQWPDVEPSYNLIVNDGFKTQHIGDYNPIGNTQLPFITGIAAFNPKFKAAQQPASSEHTVGGGILSDGIQTNLLTGVTLDTNYIPTDAAGTLYPLYGGVRIWELNTPTKSCIYNLANFSNMSHQNYQGWTGWWIAFAGVGSGNGWSYGEPLWHGDQQTSTIYPQIHPTTEDNCILGLTSSYETCSIYTGISKSTWAGMQSTCANDEQSNINYQPLNPLQLPQIIKIQEINYQPLAVPTGGTGIYAAFANSALYYNLVDGCAGPPSLTTSITANPVGCAGATNPSTGVIEIEELSQHNLENCIINWTHPAGQLSTTLAYSAGSSNHTGTYTSTIGSTLISSGTSGGRAEGLIAGTHTIDIVDILSTCTYTITVSLTAITTPNPGVSGTITQSVCGLSNGGVTTSVVYTGNAPYTYSWVNNATPGTVIATTSSISSVAAGTYTVVVTDVNGCSTTQSFIVTDDTTQSISISHTVTNISCNGANDGTVTLDSLTGTFSFNAFNPVAVVVTDPNGVILATGNIISTPYTQYNLLPGNGYTLAVTATNGCTDSVSFNILEPSLLNFSASVTPLLCYFSNVSFTTSGGQTPYAYYYKLSSSSTWLSATNPLQNLLDGIYDFKVVDAAGCESIELTTNVVGGLGVQIQAPVITMVSCNGVSDGSVIFLAQDENTGFYILNTSYSIIIYNSGSSTVVTTTVTNINYNAGPYGQQHNLLPAGTYDAVVTTATNGCTDTITFVITEPDPITIIGSYSDESCVPGGGDGSITLTVIGGTPAYNFSWTKDGVAIASTSNALTSLTAGVFIVTVTDSFACTASLTIPILGDQTEDTTVHSEVGPTCSGGDNGSFIISNTTGDFPFQVWLSTTSSTTGFLQIQRNISGNSGSNQYFDSVDLVNLIVHNLWTYVVSGATLSLPAAQNFWIYLMSTTNSCQGPTSGFMIPGTSYVSMVVAEIITDATCCDECGGAIDITVTGGAAPYTYIWSSTNAATSTTNSAIYPGATTQNISNLCPGEYTVYVTDDCGETLGYTYTVDNNPLVITDIQYQHPYCKDCHCGTISIEAEGGDGDPLVYTCNNGLHWVDTDPLSIASGPIIFNITNYNSSTVTPGTWTPGTPPGFSNLDDGIYRIWVRDHSPCSAPAFDDMVYDCHSSGGPSSCVNFCVDCSSPNCYADFVDIFADHSVAPWNGGTKVELENLSTLTVTHLSHSGTSTMGGSNGSFKFAVEESYFWTGMEWYFEIYVIDPSTSSLPWDNSLLSSTYGDVCCDVPGNSSCSIDCCDDIVDPFVLGLTTGQGGLECVTSVCTGTVSTWCPQVVETSTGTEICPVTNGGNSIGYYTYAPTLGQMGVPVEFELKNLSVTATLGPAALEAMYIVRVTNNVVDAPPSSYGGISGSPIVAMLNNCDDCAAAVIDNGMYNFINLYGAEHCDCNCPPGYILDENQYVEDPPGSGTMVINPDYNQCVGFTTSLAPNYAKCFDPNTGIPYSGNLTSVDCLNNNGVWKNNWNAVTVMQNMPCCFNALTWGSQGAKLYGDWSSGNFSSPVPIGQDISLLPYVTTPAPPSAGENSVIDSGGGLLTTHSSWQNLAPVFTTRLVDIGIWVEWFTQYTNAVDDHLPINDKIGITVCTEDILQSTTFILALAGDDRIEFAIDGVDYIKVINNTTPLANPQYNMWNLFPISLNAGTHTLQFSGYNSIGPAAFAFELYPFDVGGTPTVSYLANPAITALDIQNIVVSDYAGNPISSEHYIGEEMHSTSVPFVGHKCPPSSYLTYCGGVFKCATIDEIDPDCPECLEDIEDIVGCVGNLATTVHNQIIGGLLDKISIHDNVVTIWGVLLIRYLIKRFSLGLRGTCITPKVLVSWAKFLTDVCPDCESNVKTINEVNYLPDPNEGTSPIPGLDGADDINTFDF
jgi:hypothetical protein